MSFFLLLTLYYMFQTMFKLREIHHFIQGKGAFHLVAWSL